jgi:hypothetical protein
MAIAIRHKTGPDAALRLDITKLQEQWQARGESELEDATLSAATEDNASQVSGEERCPKCDLYFPWYALSLHVETCTDPKERINEDNAMDLDRMRAEIQALRIDKEHLLDTIQAALGVGARERASRNDPKGQTSRILLHPFPTESRLIGETPEIAGEFAVQIRSESLRLDFDDVLEIESLPGLETDPSSKGKGKNVGRKPGDETLEEFRKLVGIGSGKDVEAGRPARGLYHEISRRYKLLQQIYYSISIILIISLLLQIIFAVGIIAAAAIRSSFTSILAFGIVNLILIGIVILLRGELQRRRKQMLQIRKVKEAAESMERAFEGHADSRMDAKKEAGKIFRMYDEAVESIDTWKYKVFPPVDTRRDDPQAACSESTYNKPLGTTNTEGLRQSTMLAQDTTKIKKPETQFETSPPSTVPQLKRTSTF